MAGLPVLAVSFVMNIVGVLFVICAVALILIILVQKGRGGGLSSAFGGGASGGILGTKTGDFLTWVTIGLVAMFLLLAVVMAKYYRPSVTGFDEVPAAGAPASQPEQPTQPEDGPGTDLGSADTPPEGGADTD
jgi:preprotein translocase subunit SecG